MSILYCSLLLIALGASCHAMLLPPGIASSEKSHEEKLELLRNTLPKNDVTKEMIDNMIINLEDQIDMIENGGLSLLRSKRSSAIEEELGEPMNNTRNFTAHFNYATQYCCQDIDPGQTETIEVVKAHIVYQQVKKDESYKCGLFGWNRCSTSSNQIIQNTVYTLETEIRTKPADEWAQGCPDEHIVCCAGYVYYPKVENCLTLVEFEELLRIVREYKEELLLLNEIW